MSECPGGGYVLGGRTAQLSPNTYTPGDFELTRISATGTPQWTQSLGGPSYELLNTVLPLATGGLLAVGTSDSAIGRDKTSASRGVADIWVLKLADTALGVTRQLPGAALSLYPNPASTSFFVQATGLPDATTAELELLNTVGQVVYQSQAPVQRGAMRQELRIDNLAVGLYTLRIRVAGGVVVRQLAKN